MMSKIDINNFIDEFNLVSTMSVKDCYEWAYVLNNNINKEIDYSNSISLYSFVNSFNNLYLRFKNDIVNLPDLGIDGDIRIIKYDGSKNEDHERLIMFVDNHNDKRFRCGEGILYIERIDDVYNGYLTNGLFTFEEGFCRKHLSLSDEDIKKYLEIGSKYDVLIDSYRYFKNRQIFGNGTSMVFVKINGELLDGINTFEISLGNVYFNREDYVNVVFRLGDKLEIDYDKSILKLDNILYDDKSLIIDEIVKKIYVNNDGICSSYDNGKKVVNSNVRKMLSNS